MGFGGAPSPPPPPPEPPAMGDQDTLEAQRAMKERLRKRKGLAATILTSPYGTGMKTGGSSILGG